jgi:pimeloyl-ACP methyl ester carboxylesterase
MRKINFVLVPGAWCGAWAWQKVAPLLREAGHTVSALTLTGLGDRRRDATTSTNLTTHIEDVAIHMEMEGLDDVTLVGWSYGGMVATGVAETMPHRVSKLLFLDGFVPENGHALVDYLSPERRAACEAQAQRNEPLPPLPLERFGVSNPDVSNFIMPRLIGQPWRTFFEPLELTGASDHIDRSYVRCARAKLPHFEHTYERMKGTVKVRTSVIDADHFCVLSDPEMTARILLEA